MLAHSVLSAPSAEPSAYMLFLHGILGTRANWRGIAREFVRRRPPWGAILVDLPEHGDSVGMSPPYTLHAAAAAVRELEHGLGLPIRGALGHSFGGKVVLEWLRDRVGRPTEAWIVDSSPSPVATARDVTGTRSVIELLATLPRTWDSRDAFVEALVAAGQPDSVAQWLAMSLKRTDDERRVFGPDIEVIRALVEDYARTDCWDVVEALPADCTLDVVAGGRSEAVSREDRRRLESLAARDGRVALHVIEQAGHWVHVDAAEPLLRLLTSKAGPQR